MLIPGFLRTSPTKILSLIALSVLLTTCSVDEGSQFESANSPKTNTTIIPDVLDPSDDDTQDDNTDDSTDSEITAEKDLVDAKLNEMSLQYGESAQQMIDWYNSDPLRLASVESIVVEELVAKHVVHKAKVNVTEKNFQEIMNPQR